MATKENEKPQDSDTKVEKKETKQQKDSEQDKAEEHPLVALLRYLQETSPPEKQPVEVKFYMPPKDLPDLKKK